MLQSVEVISGFYGVLGERFCHLEEKWVEKFYTAFQEQVNERKGMKGKEGGWEGG